MVEDLSMCTTEYKYWLQDNRYEYRVALVANTVYSDGYCGVLIYTSI